MLADSIVRDFKAEALLLGAEVGGKERLAHRTVKWTKSAGLLQCLKSENESSHMDDERLPGAERDEHGKRGHADGEQSFKIVILARRLAVSLD